MGGKGLFSNVVYNPNSPKQSGRSFYEPDDIIQDLRLSMKNDFKPVFPVGVFQLPIPGSMKSRIDDFNEDDDALLEKDTDKTLFNIKQNLFADAIFARGNSTTTLFDVLESLGPSRQKRLVIVDACRVAPGNNATAVSQRRALSRTLSMSGRMTCPRLNLSVVNKKSLSHTALKLASDALENQLLAEKMIGFVHLLDTKSPHGPLTLSEDLHDILMSASRAGVVIRAPAPATAPAGAVGSGGRRTRKMRRTRKRT